MKPTKLLYILLYFTLATCKKDENKPQPPVNETLYFPPLTGNEWQSTTSASLGWDETAIKNLYIYLHQKNTKAFIVLKNGKIVLEKYFGTFKPENNWYWASAGKTMTGMLVGIAQQEGLLDINDKTSKYLGTGWTSLPADKENLITIRHQLSMTTGLDDKVADSDCDKPACLQYKADAGTRWAYQNAPYTLLDKVVEKASGTSFNNYFQQKIRNKIGMKGDWFSGGGYNNIYISNARSMARFGLLLMNKGKWDQTSILSDTAYFNAQTNTSQTYNLSYGYLTWLNGKGSHMLPNLQTVFPGAITPNAPPDMIAALGKNDQKIYVVPSQQLVVIRMGESAGIPLLALSDFENEVWGRLRGVLGN